MTQFIDITETGSNQVRTINTRNILDISTNPGGHTLIRLINGSSYFPIESRQEILERMGGN